MESKATQLCGCVGHNLVFRIVLPVSHHQISFVWIDSDPPSPPFFEVRLSYDSI